jgi:CRP-like cAMP-binding protein
VNHYAVVALAGYVSILKQNPMDERPLDLAVLKSFSPLDGLKAENLHALARKTQIKTLEPGRLLFKEGDTDKRTFYLVTGSVELRTETAPSA